MLNNRSLIRLLSLGLLAIGEEVMLGDGSIAVVDEDKGVLLEGDGFDPSDSAVNNSINRNFTQADADQQYIDTLETTNDGLRDKRDADADEIRVLRKVIADDADEMVNINAQIQANNVEIKDATTDRDLRRDIATAEIESFGDDD